MENRSEVYRLPRWMKVPMPKGEKYSKVKHLIKEHGLHTICTSGNCPNKGECWNAGTASFMIMGSKCTRNCRFCYVETHVPDALDWDEPARLAETIHTLDLKHAVITSVTRDDLPDGGAKFWAATIEAIKGGWTDLVLDQQPFLQGYLPIVQICLTEKYQFSGLHIDTGSGFVDSSNVEQLAPLAEEQIR